MLDIIISNKSSKLNKVYELISICQEQNNFSFPAVNHPIKYIDKQLKAYSIAYITGHTL